MKASALPTFLLLLAAAACSGGGGSAPTSSGGNGQNLEIILDTTTSSDASLDAQVDVVALEHVDGTFTSNLLATPILLRLADPSGRPARILLQNVPEGSYQAARVLFHGDGGSLRTADNKVWSLSCNPIDDRVLFDEVHHHHVGDDRFLALRHRGLLEVGDDGNGGRRWRPDLSGRSGVAEPLALVELRVGKIDAPNHTFQAELHAHGGEVQVSVRVPETASLFGRSKTQVDRATFFAQLATGAEVKATGSLETGMVFRIDVARIDDGSLGGGNGNGSGVGPESEGKVSEVRVGSNEIVVVPRGDDPLIVAGKSVPSQLVRLGSGTRLFLADQPTQALTLSQVQSGWRIWVRGTLAADGALQASWVRVRS